ncbi:MAG: Zn-ribbon containing protein [Candidatus Micrarchaeota archaeon]
MPHKCVRCNRTYPDGDTHAVISGCECGAKVFIFIKGDGDLEAVEDVRWIEEELAGIVKKTQAPVSLEVENVRVLQNGIFEIDISSLTKNPVVVKDSEGVYYLRLPKPKKR